jgi:hypothetical protein
MKTNEYRMARRRFGLYVLQAKMGFEYAPFQQEGICLALEQLALSGFLGRGDKLTIHAPPRMGRASYAAYTFRRGTWAGTPRIV